jgi:hypothetical protein
LGFDDDVFVFTKGDGMVSPSSGNLFFDTAAFLDQEHLHSAFALFSKKSHTFKSNSGSGSPLSVVASQYSAKSMATCAAVASFEADDTVALELFDQQPFHPIAKEVAAANICSCKNMHLLSSRSQRSWAASPVDITRNAVFLQSLCVSRPWKTMMLLLTIYGSLHQCQRRSKKLCTKSRSMVDTTQAPDWHRDRGYILDLARNVSCCVVIRS